MAAAKVQNGFSNLPSMAPRPFKKCACGAMLAPSQTYCATCTQAKNKGVTPDADIIPTTLDSPGPDHEGGK